MSQIRILSLLKMVGLTERLVINNKISDIDTLNQILSTTSIDYSELERQKIKSIEFLESNLKKAEEYVEERKKNT